MPDRSTTGGEAPKGGPDRFRPRSCPSAVPAWRRRPDTRPAGTAGPSRRPGSTRPWPPMQPSDRRTGSERIGYGDLPRSEHCPLDSAWPIVVRPSPRVNRRRPVPGPGTEPGRNRRSRARTSSTAILQTPKPVRVRRCKHPFDGEAIEILERRKGGHGSRTLKVRMPDGSCWIPTTWTSPGVRPANAPPPRRRVRNVPASVRGEPASRRRPARPARPDAPVAFRPPAAPCRALRKSGPRPRVLQVVPVTRLRGEEAIQSAFFQALGKVPWCPADKTIATAKARPPHRTTAKAFRVEISRARRRNAKRRFRRRRIRADEKSGGRGLPPAASGRVRPAPAGQKLSVSPELMA